MPHTILLWWSSAQAVVALLAVTMVFPEDRVMARMFNEEMATFYEKYYQDKGVKFVKGDVATGFEGEGKVEGQAACIYTHSGQSTPTSAKI